MAIAQKQLSVADYDLSPRTDISPIANSLSPIVRTALLAAVFLVLCISFQPFQSLAEAPDASPSGNVVTQVGYSILFLLLAAWCLFHEPRRLLMLARPVFIGTLCWVFLCVVTSWEPSLSARRFAFALLTIGIAGMVMLLAKSTRHFGDTLGVVVLIVLLASYFGVIFAPELSIHQATDFAEPELAGDWRGVFAHKNTAGAIVALFIFVGLFVARARSLLFGGLLVALSVPFLVLTGSKTSIVLLPVVLIVSFVIARMCCAYFGVGFALLILVAFNVLTVGSIYIAPVHDFLVATMSDPTFTGRTDVWRFSVAQIMAHPIAGYGFSTFWGTEEVLYGMGANSSWANTAGHAHNGYLELALTLGIPGMVLMILWLIVLPIRDYYRASRDPASVALNLLFLRICLFGAYQSCFESGFMEVGVLWFFPILAAFGLRFSAVARVNH